MEKRWWYLLCLIPLFYRPTLGLLLIFLLPGYGFVLNLFKLKNSYERTALAIALSLCLVVLNGFILNMTVGLSFPTVLISLSALTIVPLFIYVERKDLHFHDLKFKKPKKEKLWKCSLLVLSLIVLAVVVYKPHFDNPYPIHLDEWSRILETEHIIEEGSFLENINPQFVGHPAAEARMNPGFQFILSQFYILSGVDHIMFFKFLPALFAVLTGFILFSFLRKISNYWVGIFGILIMLFLKTNDNSLGISYLVALSMTFPLIYAMFYAFYNNFKEKNSLYLLLGSFIYFTILVIHEQTGAAFLPIVLIYLLISFIKFILDNHGEKFVSIKGTIITLVSFFIPLASLYVARDWLWKGSLSKSLHYLGKLIVWEGVSNVRYSYNFVLFYGLILSVLAIIGIIFLVKNIDMNVFVLWGLIAVGQVINFQMNAVTYFSYIERVRHHAVLGLIPLSAFGLYYLIEQGAKYFKKKDKIIRGICLAVLVICSIIALTYVDDGDYLPDDKRPKNGLVVNPTIEKADYEALLFLKNISYKNVVLADKMVSAAIYPISRNYIVASAQSRHGGGKVEDVRKFFQSLSCIDKQNIIYQNNVRYVLSRKPIDCSGINEIYSDKRYIYEVE